MAPTSSFLPSLLLLGLVAVVVSPSEDVQVEVHIANQGNYKEFYAVTVTEPDIFGSKEKRPFHYIWEGESHTFSLGPAHAIVEYSQTQPPIMFQIKAIRTGFRLVRYRTVDKDKAKAVDYCDIHANFMPTEFKTLVGHEKPNYLGKWTVSFPRIVFNFPPGPGKNLPIEGSAQEKWLKPDAASGIPEEVPIPERATSNAR